MNETKPARSDFLSNGKRTCIFGYCHCRQNAVITAKYFKYLEASLFLERLKAGSSIKSFKLAARRESSLHRRSTRA